MIVIRTAAAAIGLLLGAGSPVFAAFPCDELWAERNAVFHDAGYCFKSPKAIKAFGNAGCQYDEIADVPLSERDRQKVDEIKRDERRNDCPG